MSRAERRTQDTVMMLLGLWLLASPVVLQYPDLGSIASIHSFALGAVILVLGSAALARPKMWEEWFSFALGMWLMISPLLLHYDSDVTARWNQIILGLLVCGDALWAMIRYPPQRPIMK
jgi:SPW repeat